MADSDVVDGRVPLLGQLAGEGWFLQMGEVAATKSLSWLAADPRLRDALLTHLGTRADTDLSSVTQLVPETVHDDRSRPDIAMLDTDGYTVAVVEAKFSAYLADSQMAAYLDILSRRSGPHPGALFVLVPSTRAAKAQHTLNRTIAARGATAIPHAVLTWEEWLRVWAAVAEDTHDAALASDLRQLSLDPPIGMVG